ncbi:hypothetical protein RB653_008370 [Dictyostelium firmibasis]|uniref:Lipid-binding serum glycoprotein C-terminal domain-containing protein n=1 Tax=Dictyostelium firmibasis TaxID=79012 RepID=A0AAN7TYV7_9MYCE
MIKFLLLISIVIGVVVSQTGNYPPGGIYVGLSSNFLTNQGQTFTTYAQNELLSMSLPDQSGSSSSASYTFSSFKLGLTLDELFYNELSSDLYQIGWNTIEFELQWNYHICANAIFNPCEDGNIQVGTVSGATTAVASNLIILFNSTSSSIVATNTTMSFDQGAIQVNVHCSNAICVIPVGDIANDVAQNFITELTNGITKAINNQAPTIEALFTPIKLIPMTLPNGDSLWINLEGTLVEESNPVADLPTITAALNGGVILENTDGNYVYPSQLPSYIPSDSQLESFTTDYSITFTGFFIESLFDAVFASAIPMTINPDEVPAASPVHLNTSDDFFSGVAPGLSQYPNLGIQIDCYSPVTPLVSINSSVISLVNLELSADFIVLNGDNPFTAFSVLFTIDAGVSTDIVTDSPSTFSLNSTLTSMTPNATIISTNVGSVDPTGFVQLMQMVQGIIKIPSPSYSVPSKYSMSNTQLQLGNQVIQITFDLVDSLEQEKIHKKPINFN